ncbi:MAG: HEPN domain-containing protein [Calditrichaeota bacterium]|nr:MAG: HEPN domain-containing protein [Calditrichota bacterium]
MKKRKISDHVRSRTREWFRKAEHELAFLEHAPFDLDDPPTDTAGKMAHMVAEYSLKAYLMLNKKRIPKSHDLLILLERCMEIFNDKDFETLRDHCIRLLRYRVELTYPGPISEEISVKEAREAIGDAKAIMQFVLKKAFDLGYSQ